MINVFDPCDPNDPGEFLDKKIFVAIYSYILLTKFGTNLIKRVEEEANCEKERRNVKIPVS